MALDRERRELAGTRAALALMLVPALALGVLLLSLTPDATRLPPGGRLVPVSPS